LTASIKDQLIKKIFFYFGNIILVVAVFLDICHFLIYRTKISESTFFIIFETNIREASEYLEVYLSYKILLVILILITSYLLSVLLFKRNQLLSILSEKVNNNPSFKFIIFALAILFFAFYRNSFLPYAAIRSYSEYNNQLNSLQDTYNDKLGENFKNAHLLSDSLKQTIVVIIGESTSRSHMSIYGYYRNTTPLLKSKEQELIIYEDVISPNAHTLESLTKVLTLGTNKEPEKITQGSIFQLFNSVDFKTYWISNQRPLGNYETGLTAIARSSDELVFANTNYNNFDEVLFSPLKNALKQKNKNKLIFVHLMGTHIKYDERYPEGFSKFNDIPKTKFDSPLAHNTINTYDNAVLYNDFIVSSIIDITEQSNNNSSVVYFSDHGEDVYSSSNKAFHSEVNATKQMYDIPFIVWMSDKFKKDRKKLIFDNKRKLNTENFIYSLSDLAGIKFDNFDESLSIFNTNYTPKNRTILKSKTYEEYFK
jgi:heptose-I-phosphate ethanolaminephosphotransferase